MGEGGPDQKGLPEGTPDFGPRRERAGIWKKNEGRNTMCIPALGWEIGVKRLWGPGAYQLDLVTPGIKPPEASSRKAIRESLKREM